MKTKFKFIFLLILILLSTFITVYAQGGEYIVKFYDGYKIPSEISVSLEPILEDKNIYKVSDISVLDGLEKYIENKMPNKKVNLIEPENRVRAKTFSVADLWQFDMIEASYAHSLETYGNEVRVAVIDTGCYPHDEFKDNIVVSRSYINETEETTEIDEDVTDNDGHGTHLAGIIASKINDIGITGVAPRVKLVILKCLDNDGGATLYQLLKPIVDAVDEYGCRVINISWGIEESELSEEERLFFEEVVNYAADNGTIIVAAVGNDGITNLSYPAAFDNVIGVGSVDADKNKSSFSRVNRSVTVVAPGEEVKSTYKTGGYEVLSGTSQAAPFVSGLAAVALSVKENLTFGEFKEILISSCEDLGDEGYDQAYGYGLVNEKNMINLIIKNITYTSPITDNTVLVLNNTAQPINGIGIWAEYDSYGNYIKSTTRNITLEPSAKVKETGFETNNSVKFFLWDSLSKLNPLTVSREQSSHTN